MKKYQRLVMYVYFTENIDIVTLSGESGPDGLIVDRAWEGLLV